MTPCIMGSKYKESVSEEALYEFVYYMIASVLLCPFYVFSYILLEKVVFAPFDSWINSCQSPAVILKGVNFFRHR